MLSVKYRDLDYLGMGSLSSLCDSRTVSEGSGKSDSGPWTRSRQSFQPLTESRPRDVSGGMGESTSGHCIWERVGGLVPILSEMPGRESNQESPDNKAEGCDAGATWIHGGHATGTQRRLYFCKSLKPAASQADEDLTSELEGLESVLATKPDSFLCLEKNIILHIEMDYILDPKNVKTEKKNNIKCGKMLTFPQMQ